jgi:DsbC/DsbD-like thiol-disulfide interchange protein/cytochrome c biogenesis protein CcdA
MIRRLLILLALLLIPSLAQATQDRIPNITPQLVIDGPIEPGKEVDLAIVMTPKPGWHGYWLNPGDAGLPMKVEWLSPRGISVGELRYPVPARLSIAGLMNYVYEHQYAVLTRLKIPADAKGEFRLVGAGDWLACTEKICVPESGTFQVRIPVGTIVDNHALFDEWRRAMPRPLVTVGHFDAAGDKLRIAVPLPASVTVGEPYLFPMTDGVVDYAAKQSFRRSRDTLIAELVRNGDAPKAFAGVLALGDGRGLEIRAVPGSVPEGGSAIGELGAKAVLWAVLGALAGGLMLNLMPCVFPILALKAVHLSRAGGEAQEARKDALAYTAGAIVGTGALGAVLLAIRAGGSAAGWAFQLQDPRTILLLLLLATAITLNLLRVFELPVLAGRAQPAGSFGTGALAAFVATPCAGPFLGAALGTALLLPAAGSVLVFAALGLGLAIPFLLVAFLPGLRSRLPKPGAWMERFQRWLAIPMGATAFGCLWLLYRQTGADGFILGLASALWLAICLRTFGNWQLGKVSKGWGWGALAAAAVMIPLWAADLPDRATAPARMVDGADSWTEDRVASYVAQDHPVFVYFTADWCLTCKANEAAAINRDEVQRAFRKAGVKVLAGDWTNGDPAITRFLESRGRAGVPLNLWYEPGKETEELPQILTPGMLVERANRTRSPA